MIITNSRYALVGYFITSYRTRAHGIIVIYCPCIECIVLFVVTEVINYSGVAMNSQNVTELYNFIVFSEKVKKFGLAVTYKPFSSTVACKGYLDFFHRHTKNFALAT